MASVFYFVAAAGSAICRSSALFTSFGFAILILQGAPSGAAEQDRGGKVYRAQTTSMLAQLKMVSHPCYHFAEADCAIHLDHAQLQRGRLLDDLLCEELVTLEEVRQSSLWLACFHSDFPCGTSTVEGSAPKFRSRDKPDGLIFMSQERGDQPGQQSKPLDQNRRVLWRCQQIFHDQIERLTREPGKRPEHYIWRAVRPALVHIHGKEGLEERRFSRVGLSGVLGHRFISIIEMKPIADHELASDGRFARSAPPTYPADMA
jgi:hypothetical protein